MPGTGMSLHIGVNVVDPEHYAGWSGPLGACENDAEAIRELAGTQGFEARILKTTNATRSAVIGGIRRAASTLRDGDFFFLSYSGHGGQVPDRNGDDDDLKDETWCLYDGELIDDELHELWAAFQRGVRILVLSDSCHSGSVIRKYGDNLVGADADLEEGAVPRAMPARQALKTFQKNRDFYNGLAKKLPARKSAVPASVRLISGCQDDELSYEVAGHGKFTRAVLDTWDGGSFDGNYQDFHHTIVAALAPKQTPNHMVIGAPDAAYDSQKPFVI